MSRSWAASTSWNSWTHRWLNRACHRLRSCGLASSAATASTTRSSKSIWPRIAIRAAKRQPWLPPRAAAFGLDLPGRDDGVERSQIGRIGWGILPGSHQGKLSQCPPARAACSSGIRSAASRTDLLASMRTCRAMACSVRTSIASALGSSGASQLAIRAESSAAASRLKATIGR
jgi:hypothetical protein